MHKRILTLFLYVAVVGLFALPAKAWGASLFVTSALGGIFGYSTSGVADPGFGISTGEEFGIAASATNLYVTEGSAIAEYTTSGTIINSALVTGLSYPLGIAVSGGDLFVANYTDGTIGEYDATTGSTVNASLISGLYGPYGVTVSGSTLYVTNAGGGGSPTGSIGEYTTSGATINASLVGGLSGPLGIAVSGSRLFVSSYFSGTVGEYNATSGATINASFVTGLGFAAGLAVDGSYLYVAEPFENEEVGKYDITTGLGGPLLVLEDPYGIAVVPEPASIVLLGIGAIGLFVSARMRDRLHAHKTGKSQSIIPQVSQIFSAAARPL